MPQELFYRVKKDIVVLPVRRVDPRDNRIDKLHSELFSQGLREETDRNLYRAVGV